MTARSLARERVLSGFADEYELLREAEKRIMGCTGRDDVERAAFVLRACRGRWEQLMDQTSSLPMPEREVAVEYGRRLEMLERQLEGAREVMDRKGSK